MQRLQRPRSRGRAFGGIASRERASTVCVLVGRLLPGHALTVRAEHVRPHRFAGDGACVRQNSTRDRGARARTIVQGESTGGRDGSDPSFWGRGAGSREPDCRRGSASRASAARRDLGNTRRIRGIGVGRVQRSTCSRRPCRGLKWVSAFRYECCLTDRRGGISRSGAVDRRVRVHANHEWTANRPDSERSRGGFSLHRSGLLVPTTGLEPATPVLQVRCATNCAKSANRGVPRHIPHVRSHECASTSLERSRLCSRRPVEERRARAYCAGASVGAGVSSPGASSTGASVGVSDGAGVGVAVA